MAVLKILANHLAILSKTTSQYHFEDDHKVMTVTQTTQAPQWRWRKPNGSRCTQFWQKPLKASAGEPVMMSGAEMLVQALIDEGVEYIFGYQAAPCCIFMMLCSNKIALSILVRHEQAAGHMHRCSIPVWQVKLGWYWRHQVQAPPIRLPPSLPRLWIPFRWLSSQVRVPSSLIGDDAFQETDMIGVSRPVVKHSFQVRHASEIPEIVRKAFYIASSGRPGPSGDWCTKDKTAPNEKFLIIFLSR